VTWIVPDDTTPPTLTSVTPVPTPTNDPTPSYTFNTDEAGTITYGGSCTSGTTTTATLGDNTIIFDTLMAGTYNNCTITVTDTAGNTSAPLQVTEFTIDLTAPTVSSIVLADIALKAGETSLVTFTFSEAVTGFTHADLTAIENGTLTSVSSSDGGITWTATFTPTVDTTDTTNVITLLKTGVTDIAGNAGVGTTDSGNYTIDTLRPSFVFTPSNAGPTNTNFTVDITLNEFTTGFDSSDITLSANAQKGSFSTISSTLYRLVINPINDGNIMISINA